jgi:hypothetical protein
LVIYGRPMPPDLPESTDPILADSTGPLTGAEKLAFIKRKNSPDLLILRRVTEDAQRIDNLFLAAGDDLPENVRNSFEQMKKAAMNASERGLLELSRQNPGNLLLQALGDIKPNGRLTEEIRELLIRGVGNKLEAIVAEYRSRRDEAQSINAPFSIEPYVNRFSAGSGALCGFGNGELSAWQELLSQLGVLKGNVDLERILEEVNRSDRKKIGDLEAYGTSGALGFRSEDPRLERVTFAVYRSVGTRSKYELDLFVDEGFAEGLLTKGEFVGVKPEKE